MVESSRIFRCSFLERHFYDGQASILRMLTKALLVVKKSRSQIRHGAPWNRQAIVDYRNEGCSLKKIGL